MTFNQLVQEAMDAIREQLQSPLKDLRVDLAVHKDEIEFLRSQCYTVKSLCEQEAAKTSERVDGLANLANELITWAALADRANKENQALILRLTREKDLVEVEKRSQEERIKSLELKLSQLEVVRDTLTSEKEAMISREEERLRNWENIVVTEWQQRMQHSEQVIREQAESVEKVFGQLRSLRSQFEVISSQASMDFEALKRETERMLNALSLVS
jgi:uncharacterized protein YigA (DUF484 family)